MWKNQYHPVSQLSQCIYLLLPFKLDVVELHISLLPLNNKIFVSTKFLWWCKKFHWFRLFHIWFSFSQLGLLLLGKFPDTLIWNEKKPRCKKFQMKNKKNLSYSCRSDDIYHRLLYIIVLLLFDYLYYFSYFHTQNLLASTLNTRLNLYIVKK